MTLAENYVPAADYIINKDPWLKRLGARAAGKSISSSMLEAIIPVLRGRPIYDRLPGLNEAYNKETESFINNGTIVLPEAETIINEAEDAYFRARFPEQYRERDYVTGSSKGPGSAALFYEDTLNDLKIGDNVSNKRIFIRSALIFWANEAIRDSSNILKNLIQYNGQIFIFPDNASGWLWIDSNGTLQITESLPDGVANLTSNIWCNPNADAFIGEKACAVRLIDFRLKETEYRDILDVGKTSEAPTWIPENNAAPKIREVAPLYQFSIRGGILERLNDYRRFNRGFEYPIARWLTEYWDNLLQEKREVIETFVDDYLNPDTVGFQFIGRESNLRTKYKPRNLDLIIDAWDFGLIDPTTNETDFNFLTAADFDELFIYDANTHLWLDWLAQHFGLQDNGTPNRNYWHRGSRYSNNLRDNEVYYTIAEKRTLLRNALAQDQLKETTFIEENNNSTLLFWNSATSPWSQENATWDNSNFINTNATEFKFARFPFSVYNRIKPRDWQSLLRAKGTINGVHFMFDLLGLHGHVCKENKLRTNIEAIDFEIPLTLVKPSNSVTIEYKKVATENGIEESSEFRTEGYINTGIIKADETVLMKGYEGKVLVRTPFWQRPSQPYNRLQEIIHTYAPHNKIVAGNYYFVPNLSAADEPIWNLEVCRSHKYLITTWLLNSNSVSGDVINYMQDATSENTWETSGFNREPLHLEKTWATDPVYVDERTILVALAKNRGDNNAGDNIERAFPLLKTVNNGVTYKEAGKNYFNKKLPDNLAVKYAIRLKTFDNNIYLIAENYESRNIVLRSIDAGDSWTILKMDASIENQLIFDIAHNIDAGFIIIATNIGIYRRFRNEATWILLAAWDLVTFPNFNVVSASIALDTNNEIIATYIFSDNVSLNCRTLRSPNLGITWLQEFEAINYDNVFGEERYPETKILYVNSDEFSDSDLNVPQFLFLVTSNNNVSFILTFNSLQQFIKQDNVAENINNLLDAASYTINDVTVNYNNARLEYLVTTYNNARTAIAAFIVSSDLNFSNFKIEEKNINLRDDSNYTQTPRHFLRKQITLKDVNNEPLKEDINFVTSKTAPPINLQLDNNDASIIRYINIWSPVIDVKRTSHWIRFNEEAPIREYYWPLATSDFFNGYRNESWILPTLRGNYQFNIQRGNNNDSAVLNKESILQIRNYTRAAFVEKNVFIGITANSLTDSKSVYIRLQPLKGCYAVNFDNNSNSLTTATTSNEINITWSDYLADEINLPFYNNVTTEFALLYPWNESGPVINITSSSIGATLINSMWADVNYSNAHVTGLLKVDFGLTNGAVLFSRVFLCRFYPPNYSVI